MSKSNGGCTYGKVTRNMVENLVKEFDEFKKEIRKSFEDLEKTNRQLYNHLSNRSLPSDNKLIKFMIGIIGALIGFSGALVISIII